MSCWFFMLDGFVLATTPGNMRSIDYDLERGFMAEATDTYAAILGATAPIEWKALEPHFALGQVLTVAQELDLMTVAEAFTRDDSAAVKGWMQAGLVQLTPDAQAADWHERDPDTLWAVVIRPWVLVQERAVRH